MECSAPAAPTWFQKLERSHLAPAPTDFPEDPRILGGHRCGLQLHTAEIVRWIHLRGAQDPQKYRTKWRPYDLEKRETTTNPDRYLIDAPTPDVRSLAFHRARRIFGC